jgi:hypothetical protein
MKGYPRWFEPVLLATTSLVYATGCLLTPTTLELRASWQMVWRLASTSRSGVAAAHAAVAFVFLIVIGSLWSVHMRAGWRRHRQRLSGLLLLVSLLWLTFSAVGVYYLVDEAWANVAGLGHALMGVLLVVPFIWHAIVGWRYRRRVRLGLHPH